MEKKLLAIFGKYASGKTHFIQKELSEFLNNTIFEDNDKKINFKKKITLSDIPISDNEDNAYTNIKVNIYLQLLKQMCKIDSKLIQDLQLSELIIFKNKFKYIFNITIAVLFLILVIFMITILFSYKELNLDTIKSLLIIIFIIFLFTIILVKSSLNIFKEYKIDKIRIKNIEMSLKVNSINNVMNISDKMFIQAFNTLDNYCKNKSKNNYIPIVFEDFDRYEDIKFYKLICDISKITDTLFFIFALDKYNFSSNYFYNCKENTMGILDKKREVVSKFFDYIIEIPSINNNEFISEYNEFNLFTNQSSSTQLCNKNIFKKAFGSNNKVLNDEIENKKVSFKVFCEKSQHINADLAQRMNNCYINVREKNSLMLSAYLLHINNSHINEEIIFVNLFFNSIFSHFQEFEALKTVKELTEIVNIPLNSHKDDLIIIREIHDILQEINDISDFRDYIINEVDYSILTGERIRNKNSQITYVVSKQNVKSNINSLDYDSWYKLCSSIFEFDYLTDQLAKLFSARIRFADFRSIIDKLIYSKVNQIDNYKKNIVNTNINDYKTVFKSLSITYPYLSNKFIDLLIYLISQELLTKYSIPVLHKNNSSLNKNQLMFKAQLLNGSKIIKNENAELEVNDDFLLSLPIDHFDLQQCINNSITSYLLENELNMNLFSDIYNRYFNTLQNAGKFNLDNSNYNVIFKVITDTQLLKRMINNVNINNIKLINNLLEKYNNKIFNNEYKSYLIDEFDTKIEYSYPILNYINQIIEQDKLESNSILDLSNIDDDNIQILKNNVHSYNLSKLLEYNMICSTNSSLENLKVILRNNTGYPIDEAYPEFIQRLDLDKIDIRYIDTKSLFTFTDYYTDFNDFNEGLLSKIKIKNLIEDNVEEYKIISFIIYQKYNNPDIQFENNEISKLSKNPQFCQIFNLDDSVNSDKLLVIFKWLLRNKLLINNYIYRIEEQIDLESYLLLLEQKTDDHPLNSYTIDDIYEYFNKELHNIFSFTNINIVQSEFIFNEFTDKFKKTKSEQDNETLMEYFSANKINEITNSKEFSNAPIETKVNFITTFISKFYIKISIELFDEIFSSHFNFKRKDSRIFIENNEINLELCKFAKSNSLIQYFKIKNDREIEVKNKSLSKV